MNSIEAALSGRLGGDPELRTSQAGKPWARFSVAVGIGDDTQWVSISCFGEDARRVAERLHKGDRCYVEGTIRLNQWTDSVGAQRYGLQFAAWKVEPLGQIGQRKPAGARRRPDAAEGDGADYQRSLDLQGRHAV